MAAVPFTGYVYFKHILPWFTMVIYRILHPFDWMKTSFEWGPVSFLKGAPIGHPVVVTLVCCYNVGLPSYPLLMTNIAIEHDHL